MLPEVVANAIYNAITVCLIAFHLEIIGVSIGSGGLAITVGSRGERPIARAGSPSDTTLIHSNCSDNVYKDIDRYVMFGRI